MNQLSKSLLIAFCLALLPIGLWAASATSDAASLPMRGITAVTLEVDGVEESLAAYGLGRSALIAAASERLTQAGIEVITPEDMARRPDAAVLSLRVRLIRAPYYFYLYGVNLSLHSKVALAQAPEAYTIVETWSDGSTGAVQPSDLAPLRVLSLQLIDSFIVLHAQQNPG